MKRSIALAGAVALAAPAVVGLTLMATAADRVDAMATVPAAVVNLDQMVTVDGQTMYGGRVIAGELTSPADEADRTLDFQLVDAETAADGLADGTYAAVVTIPEEFSATLGTLNSDNPQQARIIVTTNDASAAVLSEMSDEIAAAAVRSLGTQVTTGFVGGVFDGMVTLADSLGAAADGAGELASGTDQFVAGVGEAASGAGLLATGLVALDGGAGQLADGIGALASGLGDFAHGAHQSSSGAAQIAGGTQQLSSGANELAGGLTQLNAGMPQLTGGATQLAGGLAQFNDVAMERIWTGANGLATGTQELVDGIADIQAGLLYGDGTNPGLVPAAQGLDAGASGVSNWVSGLVGGLGQMAANCVITTGDPATDLCLQVQGLYASTQSPAPTQPSLVDAASGVATGMSGLAGGLNTFATDPVNGLPAFAAGIQAVDAGADQFVLGIQQARTQGLVPLLTGANQLAAGLGQTAAAIGQLDGGASQLAGGLGQTNDGMQALSGGLSTLAQGADALASGASQSASGARQLAAGTGDAAAGATELADGLTFAVDEAAPLVAGASELAAGLAEGVDQLPTYSDAQRTQLAELIAEPVGTDTERLVASPNNATTLAGLVLGIGLWVGAFGAYLVLPAVPARAMSAPMSSFRATLAGLRNGLLFAVAQALLAGVVLPVFGVSPANAIGAALIAVLTALSFVAIHQGLIAAFGKSVGAVVSVALLALQVAALGVVFPISSAPAFLQSVASLAPLNLGADLLTQQILGGTIVSVGRNVALLVVWALVGIGLTALAANRRRQLSVSQIRAELVPA